jgi:hypothetical protein
MKTLTRRIGVPTFLLGTCFALPASADQTPSSFQIKIYKFAVSTSVTCDSPVVVYSNDTPSYAEVSDNPIFGTAHVNDGTYKCVMIQMSDIIKFSASQDDATCHAGEMHTMDVCADHPGSGSGDNGDGGLSGGPCGPGPQGGPPSDFDGGMGNNPGPQGGPPSDFDGGMGNNPGPQGGPPSDFDGGMGNNPGNNPGPQGGPPSDFDGGMGSGPTGNSGNSGGMSNGSSSGPSGTGSCGGSGDSGGGSGSQMGPDLSYQNLDGTLSACSPVEGHEDLVVLYLSVGATDRGVGKDSGPHNGFLPPTQAGDSAHGMNLGAPLVVNGPSVGTFVIDARGKVTVDNGQCGMQPPLFSFE